MAKTHLLLMACSGLKLDRPAPALELYRGVMYESFRKHVAATARPHVIILSALHGFLSASSVIEPYDVRMNAERSQDMLIDLDGAMRGADWPGQVDDVFLAGGELYRRVMRAAVERQYGESSVAITGTHGAIGVQRSQLGQYLRHLAQA